MVAAVFVTVCVVLSSLIITVSLASPIIEIVACGSETITPPINNLNYVIILDGKNRRKKIITKRVV